MSPKKGPNVPFLGLMVSPWIISLLAMHPNTKAMWMKIMSFSLN
ncbi:hypothetical protein SAMN05216476_0985 [Pseudomonas mediterranea]|uniref:Uncharacterized protein n=1 Tax=Pseudomonas mediterranea TaxID=183795 RepID=A0AAX2D7C8_9PSED|nr:hypothetical protein SAMN05216476_0985 [Pseudomonas mediterranea]